MSLGQHDLCRVCGGTSRHVFAQTVLGESVNYFDCVHCGYLQTEEPHWLERAYSHAINDVDTGIMVRNQTNVGRVVMTLAAYSRLNGVVVDHAGGYGILVRMLRDAGVEALWRDRYCENLLARGFEADGQPADLITAFEVMEHLVDPVKDLRAMLKEAPVVLLSTELVPTEATPLTDWWYLGPEHGQHVGFFRGRTLAHIASLLGVYFATDGRSLHVLSTTPVPRRWQMLQRAKRFWWPVARIALRSRTMQDFERLRQQATHTKERQ
jgi:hypothetical protein